MSGIIRVRHRHGDQTRREPDLTLTMGEPIPDFYQAGRRRGLVVTAIVGGDPIRCVLSDGDVILVGQHSVVEIMRRSNA